MRELHCSAYLHEPTESDLLYPVYWQREGGHYRPLLHIARTQSRFEFSLLLSFEISLSALAYACVCLYGFFFSFVV